MLHKLPSLALVLQNVDKKTKSGYIYLRAKVPGKKTQGKSPYVAKSLNLRVPVQYWDSENEIATKGFDEAARVNRLATTEKQRLSDLFDKDYEAGVIFTEQHIRSRMYPQQSVKDFMILFEEHLEFIKSTWSENYHRAYEQGYTTLKSFVGSTLSYHAITSDLLESYQKFLSTDKRVGGKRVKKLEKNTIYLRMRYMREVIEKAIDKKLMDKDQIEGYKWPAYKAPVKPYLTLEQTETIANKIYNGEFDNDITLKTTACYFLVECYSGIRFSDWGSFTIEKLIEQKSFKVSAAQKNLEPVYLPFSDFPRLERIVEHIIGSGLIFALAQGTANRILKNLMIICGINIHVTTHTGRRTCATLLAELGWDTRHIAEVLAISEDTVKSYIKSTRQGIKNASRRHGGL